MPSIDPTDFGLPADAGKLTPSNDARRLWRGPCDDGDNGGVTVELLSRFLRCPERTRLRYVEGLVPVPRFDHKKVFARMWNVAADGLAGGSTIAGALDDAYDECDAILAEFPGPEETKAVVHWFNVLVCTFQGWARHRQENPIDQGTPRSVLRLPRVATPVLTTYELPSGRSVVLKGPEVESWKIGVGPGSYFRIERRVVKGDLRPDRLQSTARFDLDTMFCVTLHGSTSLEVYYDCVRRPLSGGKGSISKLKPTKRNPNGESDSQFYIRLRETVLDLLPGHWYPHFLVELQPSDVTEFHRKCLNPALERLCDWYDEVHTNSGYTAPFSIDAPATEYDEYLLTGSERGLMRSQVAFPELSEGS